MGYWVAVGDREAERLDELADLCAAGRDAFAAVANDPDLGFQPLPRSEAAAIEHLTTRPSWPGGTWPTGAASALHQVGLMIALASSGHVGEMAPLLRSRDCAWSIPLLSRAAIENCARLFAILTRPFVGLGPGEAPGAVQAKQVYAAAYCETLAAGFRRVQATTHLPEDHAEAEQERDRLVAAYGTLFDEATTDVSSLGRLALEGTRPAHVNMTALVDELAKWVWSQSEDLPPLYRLLSGLSHSSIDAQMSNFRVDDIDGRRSLGRAVALSHFEDMVFLAGLIWQRTFARLTGFYGWPEEPVDRFGELLAAAFPENFRYG